MTVRNVRYQSVSAAISATRDKQSRIQSRVNLKLRAKNALRADVFVVVFSFMMCSSRSRAARMAARIHLTKLDKIF